VNLVTLLRAIILQTAYNNLIEITSAKKIEKYRFGKSMSVFLHLGNFYVKSLISKRCKFNISDSGTHGDTAISRNICDKNIFQAQYLLFPSNQILSYETQFHEIFMHHSLETNKKIIALHGDMQSLVGII